MTSMMTRTMKNRRHVSRASLALCLILPLAACMPPARNAQVVASPDKVSLMLAEAADKDQDGGDQTVQL